MVLVNKKLLDDLFITILKYEEIDPAVQYKVNVFDHLPVDHQTGLFVNGSSQCINDLKISSGSFGRIQLQGKFTIIWIREN